MRVADFDFDLPADLIAQHPLPERVASRLLCIDPLSGELVDRQFVDLPALLEPGDLLVMNDTRVVPARMQGSKSTGGRVEMLVERVLEPHRCLAMLSASKPVRPGTRIEFGARYVAEVVGRRGDLFELTLHGRAGFARLMADRGQVPLPPYIRREPGVRDEERYQTVYAARSGAVAAPTAGLHFDASMLASLRESGVEIAFVTLHVGAGTFQPLHEEQVECNRLHHERVVVPAAVCEAISRARASGSRVVAVGTTSVRALEAASAGGELAPFDGDSDLFIYPGYRFRCVDALLTNFHLPRSSLLMLVCALAGTEAVLAAYWHAVGARYRFYSYGDAMFVARRS